MLRVTEAQMDWLEKAGTELDRRAGLTTYIVAQYLTRLDLRIDGEEMPAERGSILILEPNVPHYYRCPEELLHHWFHVEGDLTGLMQKYAILPNRLYNLKNTNEISALFRQISMTHHDKGAFREDYIQLKIEELFITMAMQLSLQRAASEMSYSTIVRLKELRFSILAHPEYDWTVAEMARRLYLSESYFYQLYRRCFGITPTQDLIGIRIERARTLLLHDCTVAAAAEKCGYSSVYHFIRQFKRLVGTTPYQFKKC